MKKKNYREFPPVISDLLKREALLKTNETDNKTSDLKSKSIDELIDARNYIKEQIIAFDRFIAKVDTLKKEVPGTNDYT